MEKCVHIFVSGRVQGVFFRASTRDMALQLGLNGFVRNLSDGRVEIVASGSVESIDRFVQWCQVGPPGAKVDNLQITDCETTDETYQRFDIGY